MSFIPHMIFSVTQMIMLLLWLLFCLYDMGFISNIYCSHYDGYVGIDLNGYNLLVPLDEFGKRNQKRKYDYSDATFFQSVAHLQH